VPYFLPEDKGCGFYPKAKALSFTPTLCNKFPPRGNKLRRNDVMLLFDLAQVYPQLYLAPLEGMSQNQSYLDMVRRGKPSEGGPLGKHFTGSPEDRRYTQTTPVGDVDIIFLKNRSDFENFYRIIVCRCEPTPVPETMGAVTISGISNWRKIDAHRKAYEDSGGIDWDAEFSLFIADPANYKDTLILVSEGAYSAVPASETDFNPQLWLEKSLLIRTYHEITHFICRKKYPDKKHAIWDEIVADAIGLIFAFGYYDPFLAKRFLGVSQGAYQKGRLENYTDCKGAALNALAGNVSLLIDCLYDSVPVLNGEDKTAQIFAILDRWQAESPEFIRRYLG
jgi:hypothetical protein